MKFRKYTLSEQAILTTILYSDIFSFPPTKEELWKFLIAKKRISQEEFKKSLSSLQKIIVCKNGFYCLSGKDEIIKRRRQNASEVEIKMKRARWAVEKLSHIPSVLFIGISGGLAVGNVTKDDDIDLVIIVKKNTLFASRLLILSLLQYLGVRRLRNQKITADTVCTNLFLDESALSWFCSHQDVYTAREIAQIVPLFDRRGIYQEFVKANAWIERFLPNIFLSPLRKSSTMKEKFSVLRFEEQGSIENPRQVRNSRGENLLKKIFFNSFCETLCRSLQIRIMKDHQTNEIVTEHILAFHPNDYRVKTLKQLRLKMRQLGLLTKI